MAAYKQYSVPVLGFAACSGTGKTTLLCRLIPVLKDRGMNVALIKHSHHDFEIDRPGKDSYELRKAGAGQVLLASRFRTALITEKMPQAEPVLDDLITSLDLDAIDLVLVEGFRHEAFPKIELHRPTLRRPLLYPEDPSIIAIASDVPLADVARPLLDLNRVRQIADFICEWLAVDAK